MDYLIVAWVFIIAFCVFMYVLLDGFTLGIGIILPFAGSREKRALLYSVIMPTWDGNQTWLVLAGASLYGAFPLAFSMILPTLYLPLFVMLAALLLRGVVLEFRLKSKGAVIDRWDRLFVLASVVVTFVQGVVVGTLVKGFSGSVEHMIFPAYDWLSPFSVLTGLSLVFGYALLGATRMIIKTQADFQKRFYFIAKLALFCVWVALLIISLWTPFVDPYTQSRWFNAPHLGLLALLPLTTTVAFIMCGFALFTKKEYLPYAMSILIFFCAYAGFGYSMWPYIVPHEITIWQAASNHGSLLFTFVGACIMLPVLLFYTWYAYRIFHGKVTDAIEY